MFTWLGFVSTAFSNVLSGVVAGLIVGLFLWRLQLRAEVRSTKKEYEDRYLKVEGDVRESLSSMDVSEIGTAIDAEYRTSKRLHDLLYGISLGAWRPHLPDHNDRLDLLSAFLVQRGRFARSAEALDVVLSQVIRAYNSSQNIDSVNDSDDHVFFIGRQRGLSTADAVMWMGMPATGNKPLLDRFENSYALLCARADVITASKVYLQTTEDLKKSLEALRCVLVCDGAYGREFTG